MATALWNNVQAQIDFYRHYSTHDLRIGAGEDIFEAQTSTGGNTLIRRHVLDYDPYRLSGVLLHERFHRREGQQGADPRTGNPAQEGQSYGVQWYLLNQGGSPSHRGQNVFSAVYSCGGGGIAVDFLDVFREAFHKTVALCEILNDLIVRDDLASSPALPYAHISRDEARQLWLQFQHTYRFSRLLQELYDAVPSAWTARRTPRVTRVACEAGAQLPDF